MITPVGDRRREAELPEAFSRHRALVVADGFYEGRRSAEEGLFLYSTAGTASPSVWPACTTLDLAGRKQVCTARSSPPSERSRQLSRSHAGHHASDKFDLCWTFGP